MGARPAQAHVEKGEGLGAGPAQAHVEKGEGLGAGPAQAHVDKGEGLGAGPAQALSIKVEGLRGLGRHGTVRHGQTTGQHSPSRSGTEHPSEGS